MKDLTKRLDKIIVLLARSQVPEVMSRKQCASYMGMGVNNLDALRFDTRNPIPWHKVGGMVKFTRRRVDAWLDSLLVTSNDDLRKLMDGRRRITPAVHQ